MNRPLSASVLMLALIFKNPVFAEAQEDASHVDDLNNSEHRAHEHQDADSHRHNPDEHNDSREQERILKPDESHKGQDHHNDSNHHQKDDLHGHGQEPHKASIDADMAHENGIVTASAGAGRIERHIQVYGRLVTPPGQSAAIRARFAGLITKVAVNLGDRVEQGDLLAEVEANQSLQTYALRAPFAGVIVERTATVGEITGDAPLFHLLNSDTLWAELKIFPSMRDEVKPGLPVHIDHDPDITDGHIESITTGPPGEPYTLARVPLANPHNHFSPGDLVSALIDAEVALVSVVVTAAAVQTLDGQKVVFVQETDGFVPRPIRLGRSDGRHTEVLEGLRAGETYVTENSYLVKADIEKASAEHHH